MLTYLVASAGLTPVYDGANYSDFLKGVTGVFHGAAAGTAQSDLFECVTLARSYGLPLLDAQISMCCMLSNTAFESMSDKAKSNTDPSIQFFRHVRNAPSHGNKWHFRDTKNLKEPRLPAHWNGIRLDHNMQGKKNPLHGHQCFFHTIGPADLLYLLRDVERFL
ncbi:MAG: hypothetical protein WBW93_19270 [Steroidobacteraceae bacterium]